MIDIGWRRRKGLSLTPEQRQPPMWIIGQPRVGKSRLEALMAVSDMRAGHGLLFGDPHEDTFGLLLKYAALLGQGDPELAERVVVINPMDQVWVPGINPLEQLEGASRQRLAMLFTDQIMEIFGLEANQGPRMSSMMMHSFAALNELGLTLVELPFLLRDHEWRTRVVKKHISDSEVRDYFLREFPKNERLRQEWMQSTTNKIVQLVWDEDIRLILGQRKNTVAAREAMDGGQIILANLAKTRLARSSRLLGGALVILFRQAAFARADVDIGERRPFYVYLDEAQNFVSENSAVLLSELPKFGLRMVMGHQYLEQLPLILRQGLRNTYGVLACFRTGYQDAQELIREIFLPEPERRLRWRFATVGRMPLLLPVWEHERLELERERRIQKLTTLAKREFFVRIRGVDEPIKLRTQDLPDPDCPPQVLEALVTLSGVRHERRKVEVRRELEIDRPRLLAELGRGDPPVGHTPDDDVPPIYG